MKFQIEAKAAIGSKGIATVRVIEPGWNSDKSFYYQADGLKRDHKVFESAKMFADHPTQSERRERPERSVRDLVGILEKITVAVDGSIKGVARITASWFREFLEGFKGQNRLEEVGVSIVAGGVGKEGKIQGVKTTIIEGIAEVFSVDFVTYPGAGGRVLAYESAGGGTVRMSETEQGIRKSYQNRKTRYLEEGLSVDEAERGALMYVCGGMTLDRYIKKECAIKKLREAKPSDAVKVFEARRRAGRRPADGVTCKVLLETKRRQYIREGRTESDARIMAEAFYGAAAVHAADRAEIEAGLR